MNMTTGNKQKSVWCMNIYSSLELFLYFYNTLQAGFELSFKSFILYALQISL